MRIPALLQSFTVRFIRQIVCSAILVIASHTPLSIAYGAEVGGKPNVLFLFADDQRADTIAALGNPIIKTQLGPSREEGRIIQPGLHAGRFGRRNMCALARNAALGAASFPGR